MENHQWQHHRAHSRRREQHIRHRNTVRQTFLRTAEHNGDFIFGVETKQTRHVSVDDQHNRQQHNRTTEDRQQ